MTLLTKEQIQEKLTQLYIKTDKLVMTYKDETVSGLERQEAISELLKVSEKLVKKSCIKARHSIEGIRDLSIEELMEEAHGEPLVKALNTFDSTKGVYFLVWWRRHYNGRFLNMQATKFSNKGQALSKQWSLDAPTSNGEEEGYSLGETMHSERAEVEMAELENSENLARIQELLKEFEAVSSRGWIIRADLNGELINPSRADITRLAEAKKDFKKFLIRKGAVNPEWFEGRTKRRLAHRKHRTQN